jgi:hypothetical protein
MTFSTGRCGLVIVPFTGALINPGFSRRLAKGGRVSVSRQARRERDIWRRRYWEHQIRDEIDLARHVDYIHYNPVKHGWVTRAADWSHSTLRSHIERGIVTSDWDGVWMISWTDMVNGGRLGFAGPARQPTTQLTVLRTMTRGNATGFLIAKIRSGESWATLGALAKIMLANPAETV